MFYPDGMQPVLLYFVAAAKYLFKLRVTYKEKIVCIIVLGVLVLGAGTVLASGEGIFADSTM